jgi:hypothetical protein
VIALPAAVTAVKGFLLSVKLWACVGVALIIALWSFQQGKESCQKKAYAALEKEIGKINDRAAKAVKQATKDARTLQDSKEKGNELVEEAKAAASDNCQLDPDQLRILQRIQERTKAE